MATQNQPLLGVQQISDFFKSASRNMLITIWAVRLIAIAMLYLLVDAMLTTFKPDVVQFSHLEALITFVILLVFVIFLALISLVSYAIGFVGTEQAQVDYILAVRSFFVNQIFGNIRLLDSFNQSEFFGDNVDPFAPLAYMLNKPQKEVYNPILMQGIFLLGVVIVIITGIGFIRRSDVKLAGIALVVSQLVIGLAYLKDFTVDLSLDNTSISTLLGSSLYRLALISYLYFEFSLQTGYLYNLTTPTLTRQRRVGKQLQRLSEFRLGLTKLGTDEEKDTAAAKKEHKADTEEQEGPEKTSSSLSMGSGSTSAKKFSADALVFLLDSAQDSLFSKPGGEQERLTGRLQRYHDGLLQHDKDLDNKLGGSAEKAFNPIMVLANVFLSLIVRLGILIFLSWLVVRPQVLLEFISLPPSIYNSLEINRPEGLLIVLVPVVFLIIGVSYLFAKFQDWVVKAEEFIIDEADIGKLLKAGKAITDRTQGEEQLKAMEQKETVATSNATGKPRRRRRKRKSSKQNNDQ